MHCAALADDWAPHDEALRVNRDGTRAVVRSFPGARIVHLSTSSVYDASSAERRDHRGRGAGPPVPQRLLGVEDPRRVRARRHGCRHPAPARGLRTRRHDRAASPPRGGPARPARAARRRRGAAHADAHRQSGARGAPCPRSGVAAGDVQHRRRCSRAALGGAARVPRAARGRRPHRGNPVRRRVRPRRHPRGGRSPHPHAARGSPATPCQPARPRAHPRPHGRARTASATARHRRRSRAPRDGEIAERDHTLAGRISARRTSTRRRMSSRMGRTSSSGLPWGSVSSQSS